MAHKKAGGTAKNLRDSNPKFLGVKLFAGERARIGNVLIRQRGTAYLAGAHVGIGRDHTLFALKAGIVSFTNKRKQGFDGRRTVRKMIHVS
ncbi:MAG: large subunit ribosomal protein L27 [Parcubacteria group bacterium Greene0416_79]|nr:MAG: large subunit ribosomal protein L27 [Parcubacteria group bacterium Greene0416_79]